MADARYLPSDPYAPYAPQDYALKDGDMMSTSWSERAEQYASSEIFRHGPELRVLIALARPTWSDACLDIGTGAGHTAALLAQRARSVLGLDPAEGMLRQAKERYGHLGNLDFCFGYAHDTGQLAESYDVITVRHAAHHFPDIPGFLAEAARILKPGGRLVVVDEVTTDPDIDDWFNALESLRDREHTRAYQLREWRDYVGGSSLRWVVGDDHTRLPIDIPNWLARSNIDHHERADVYEHFSLATPRERSLLNIRFEGKTPVTFDLPLGVMLMTKPVEGQP